VPRSDFATGVANSAIKLGLGVKDLLSPLTAEQKEVLRLSNEDTENRGWKASAGSMAGDVLASLAVPQARIAKALGAMRGAALTSGVQSGLSVQDEKSTGAVDRIKSALTSAATGAATTKVVDKLKGWKNPYTATHTIGKLDDLPSAVDNGLLVPSIALRARGDSGDFLSPHSSTVIFKKDAIEDMLRGDDAMVGVGDWFSRGPQVVRGQKLQPLSPEEKSFWKRQNRTQVAENSNYGPHDSIDEMRMTDHYNTFAELKYHDLLPIDKKTSKMIAVPHYLDYSDINIPEGVQPIKFPKDLKSQQALAYFIRHLDASN
jgi:hypothetical protein